MRKTRILSALVAILLCCLLTGSNNPPTASPSETNTPAPTPTPTAQILVLQPKETTEMEMTTLPLDGFDLRYEEAVWEKLSSELDSSTILNRTDTDTGCNITIDKLSVLEQPSEIDVEFIELYMANFSALLTQAVSVVNYMPASLKGQHMLYLETRTKFTEQAIEDMLRTGGLTEAVLEELGGMEALIALPETNQLAIIALINGELYQFTGSYYTETEKDYVYEAIVIMVASAIG